MPRRPQFQLAVGDPAAGLQVGYSAKPRNGLLSVRFLGPDGRPVVRQTASRSADYAFHAEAAALIKSAYGPAAALDPAASVLDALAQVVAEASNLRPTTLKSYGCAARAYLRCCPEAATLGQVNALAVARFSRVFLATTFTRSGASDAKRFKPSAVSLFTYLSVLSALWERFKDHGFTNDNPWKDAKRPELERKRKPVPSEACYDDFVAWLRGRYPAWPAVHAIIELKSLTCCRTADLAQLKTAQVKGGRLEFSAHQVKNKESRSVKLPADLSEALLAVAGREWLWGNLYDEMAIHRPHYKVLSPDRPPFRPESISHLLVALFREYRLARPGCENITPHALRRRGITLLVVHTQNVDLAAMVVGVSPRTVKAHYLDAERAFNADAVFDACSASLRPKPAADSGTVVVPPPVPAAKNAMKSR